MAATYREASAFRRRGHRPLNRHRYCHPPGQSRGVSVRLVLGCCMARITKFLILYKDRADFIRTQIFRDSRKMRPQMVMLSTQAALLETKFPC